MSRRPFDLIAAAPHATATANGTARAARVSSRPPTPLGIVTPSRDPLAAVLELGSKAMKGIVLGLLLAVLLHGSAAARAALIPVELNAWTHKIAAGISARLVETYEVDIAKIPPPPPPPPEEAKPEPKEPPPPPPIKEAKEVPPEAPAPAAARAGAVLTQQPNPDEPVDLTNGFVTGNSDSYAGGVTQQGGTSASAVYNRNAVAGGAPGGTGTAAAPPPPSVDRSRAAELGGAKEWKCPWPAEAEVEQIDEAAVVVQVATRADGTAEKVTVLSDPGHGFGREARLCAMRERYHPALDHEGNPVAGMTKSIRIRFER